MTTQILPKIIKHVVALASIFMLLKFIPQTQLSNRDIAVSSLVLFAIYIIVENLFLTNEGCKLEKFATSADVITITDDTAKNALIAKQLENIGDEPQNASMIKQSKILIPVASKPKVKSDGDTQTVDTRDSR